MTDFKRRFGLIGHPLGHSYSPLLHQELGSVPYDLYDLLPEELEGFVQKSGLSGWNITSPYKQAVIPFCSELSPLAARLNSVNTMVRLKDGRILGDNTDYYGFLYLMGEDLARFRGESALILGSGGAAQTAAAVLQDSGCLPVLVSRHGPVTYADLTAHADTRLIVNCTPVGMAADDNRLLLDLDGFPDCRLVCDLIYNPAETELLFAARRRGIATRNGLAMLVAQACRASEIFLARAHDPAIIAELTSRIRERTRNIVLIGMPGCGKSSIARELARLTGRRFVDVDEETASLAGDSIPNIFRIHGEDYFRKLETKALKSAVRNSNAVIATGGGIVTQEENYPLLDNVTVILIERPLTELAQEGRPLSLSRPIEDIYRERKDAYERWSDYRYVNRGIAATAQRIKEDLGL